MFGLVAKRAGMAAITLFGVAVVVFVLVFLMKRYHKNFRRHVELLSIEKREVAVRNATAELFESILDEIEVGRLHCGHFSSNNVSPQLPDSKRVALRKKLDTLYLNDPLTYVEHNPRPSKEPFSKVACATEETP